MIELMNGKPVTMREDCRHFQSRCVEVNVRGDAGPSRPGRPLLVERSPDINEDPREQGTAEGYPESNPADETPVEGTQQGPEAETQQEDQGLEIEGHPSSTLAGQDSPKVDQIRANGHVGVTMMSRDTWISIDGQAELVDDRARIKEYWNPFVQSWFPDGPDDPNVTLIKIVGSSAQYWDTNGGMIGAALKMARSAVTGNPPTDVGESEKVEL